MKWIKFTLSETQAKEFVAEELSSADNVLEMFSKQQQCDIYQRELEFIIETSSDNFFEKINNKFDTAQILSARPELEGYQLVCGTEKFMEKINRLGERHAGAVYEKYLSKVVLSSEHTSKQYSKTCSNRNSASLSSSEPHIWKNWSKNAFKTR